MKTKYSSLLSGFFRLIGAGLRGCKAIYCRVCATNRQVTSGPLVADSSLGTEKSTVIFHQYGSSFQPRMIVQRRTEDVYSESHLLTLPAKPPSQAIRQLLDQPAQCVAAPAPGALPSEYDMADLIEFYLSQSNEYRAVLEEVTSSDQSKAKQRFSLSAFN